MLDDMADAERGRHVARGGHVDGDFESDGYVARGDQPAELERESVMFERIWQVGPPRRCPPTAQ